MARHSHKVKTTEFNSQPRNHRFHGVINEVLVCPVCMRILHEQIEARWMRDAQGIYDREIRREHVS